ncbi:MAG: type II toxin-antitoxin system RelE/ParE family toxin [Microbacterium sp.]
MWSLLRTPEFTKWLDGLKDLRGRVRIIQRVDRLASSNPGDSKSVGNGVYELRMTFGPGYRVYYLKASELVVLLLCGGDKSSQSKDIAKAHELADRWHEDRNNNKEMP